VHKFTLPSNHWQDEPSQNSTHLIDEERGRRRDKPGEIVAAVVNGRDLRAAASADAGGAQRGERHDEAAERLAPCVERRVVG
jgi:hypothetical protein